MRILHVLDHSLPLQSGYVYRTLGILNAQRARGWETHHLTTPRHYGAVEHHETFDGWAFYRTFCGSNITGKLPALKERAEMRATEVRLDQLIDELHPDLLHAHSPVLNGIPALAAARRHNLPLIYEVRAFWEDAAVTNGTSKRWGPKYLATRGLETKILRRADAVTTICQGLRGEIIKRGVAPENVTVIPNAVDIKVFTTEATRDAALSEELGLDNAFTLGFIGSFYAYEGLDLLIEAVALMGDKIPMLKLLLIGGGPEDETLRETVRTRGLSEQIIFTGRVPHSEVQRYYSLIDVLVYPRRRMRLTELVTPLKPLEAMAQGKILAASDVGGHHELIEDGKTGFLFKADDPADLARCIGRLHDQRDLWDQVRQNGRHFVETERNWDASVAAYAPVYERLIQQRVE